MLVFHSVPILNSDSNRQKDILGLSKKSNFAITPEFRMYAAFEGDDGIASRQAYFELEQVSTNVL